MKVPIHLASLLLILSCGLPAQTRKEHLHPLELVENANTYLSQTVEVDIVEPLYGPSKPENLAKVEYGQVEVRVPEGMTASLYLVPAAFKPGDPNRFRNKFDRVIESPVRVRGELLRDEEMTKAQRRPYYVVRVSSIEPLVLNVPQKTITLNDLKAEPSRWDRQQVTYEGIYRTGFEVTALDEIWLETLPGTKIINLPSDQEAMQAHRIRVTGILFAHPGAHYGHMGGYKFQLTASKIEYLGVVR